MITERIVSSEGKVKFDTISYKKVIYVKTYSNKQSFSGRKNQNK